MVDAGWDRLVFVRSVCESEVVADGVCDGAGGGESCFFFFFFVVVVLS